MQASRSGLHRRPTPAVESRKYLDILHIFQYKVFEVLKYPMQPKSDLLQGTLDLLILKIVALGPIHGYGIAQRIQQISRDVLQVQQGSLYPALYRLEERGYLQPQWRETEQGRMAKFYTVTKKGARQLADERAQWERVAGAITLVLQEAE